MTIHSLFSVGTLYQNIAFYALIFVLAGLNIELLRHNAKEVHSKHTA